MDYRPGRKPIRRSDFLSHIIREALSEKVLHAQPSPYSRQTLLARAREAQIRANSHKFKLYPFMRLPRSVRLLPPVMSNISTGFSNAPVGYVIRDAYLSLSMNSIANPLLGVMR